MEVDECASEEDERSSRFHFHAHVSRGAAQARGQAASSAGDLTICGAQAQACEGEASVVQVAMEEQGRAGKVGSDSPEL